MHLTLAFLHLVSEYVRNAKLCLEMQENVFDKFKVFLNPHAIEKLLPFPIESCMCLNNTTNRIQSLTLLSTYSSLSSFSIIVQT